MIDFFKTNWFELLLLMCIIPAYKGIEKAIENGISNFPKNIHDMRMEEIKKDSNLFLQKDDQKSTRELQIDNYYRSISGQKVEKLFSDWMDMITDAQKITNLSQAKLNKMIKELMMYGSRETVHLGSIFMQYNFRVSQKKITKNSFELLYLGTKLIASLKKDFTGYDVNPEDLIGMTINDIHNPENEKKLVDAKAKIEDIVRDGF